MVSLLFGNLWVSPPVATLMTAPTSVWYLLVAGGLRLSVLKVVEGGS